MFLTLNIMFRDTMPRITFYRRIQKTYFCNYIRYSENGHEKKENVVENENKIRPDVFVWKKKGTANEVPKFYDSFWLSWFLRFAAR